MTPTTAAWIAVVAAAAITTVTALRGRPARVPARVPAATQRTETDENWHPHVSSGCGR